MSLFGNSFIKTDGIQPSKVYRIDDLTNFKYDIPWEGTVELQAYSRSLNKYVSLTWFNGPSFSDVRNDSLLKEITSLNSSIKQ